MSERTIGQKLDSELKKLDAERTRLHAVIEKNKTDIKTLEAELSTSMTSLIEIDRTRIRMIRTLLSAEGIRLDAPAGRGHKAFIGGGDGSLRSGAPKGVLAWIVAQGKALTTQQIGDQFANAEFAKRISLILFGLKGKGFLNAEKQEGARGQVFSATDKGKKAVV